MTDKPKKRQLKPAQSVREKAIESNTKKKKSIKFKKTKHYIALPFKKTAKFLGKYKLFRIISRIIVPYYFRTSWKELKLVTWPNRRQTLRLTFAVLAFAIVIGAFVATLDYGLSHLFKLILLEKH